MELWMCIVPLLGLFTALYHFVTKKQNYWIEQNLSGPRPSLLLGNTLEKAQNTPELENVWRNKYGRVYGIFNGLCNPVLSISDAELIKQVMVKDFANFVNRSQFQVYHEVWSENLFVLEDKKWKTMRTVVTPAFTSGKLRAMQALMNKCVTKLIEDFRRITAATSEPVVFKAKEMTTKLTVDVIASTAFAIETDSSEKDSSIVKSAIDLLNVSEWRMLAILAFPLWLNNLLGVQYDTNVKSTEFFLALCQQVVEQRRNDPRYKRNDLVQLLLDSKVDVNDANNNNNNFDNLETSFDDSKTEDKPERKSNGHQASGTLTSLTNNEIVAQLFLFLVAGYETTALTLSFALHELAVNPECQNKLRREVQQATANIEDETSEEYFVTVTSKIAYLEAVLKETMRKYPPLTRLERRCNESIDVGGVTLLPQQVVEISIYAAHMDPEYFPDPTRWRPERFMPENRDQLVPYAFLPFGTGPRNCVGMRFALQEMKLGLARIITKFCFHRAPTTKDPVEMRKGSFMVVPVTLDLAVTRR